MAMDYHLNEAKVAVMNGRDWVAELYHEQIAKFNPYTYWTNTRGGWPVTEGKEGGEPSLFVCLEGRCLKPASNRSEALAEIKL